MMWGPASPGPRPTSCCTGKTDLIDVTDLGLDRFDEHGRSRLAADPIALPVPREHSPDGESRSVEEEGVDGDGALGSCRSAG